MWIKQEGPSSFAALSKLLIALLNILWPLLYSKKSLKKWFGHFNVFLNHLNNTLFTATHFLCIWGKCLQTGHQHKPYCLAAKCRLLTSSLLLSWKRLICWSREFSRPSSSSCLPNRLWTLSTESWAQRGKDKHTGWEQKWSYLNKHTYTSIATYHKAYYYYPFINCITVYSILYLTPRSLTFSLASCPDRAASIRSASWFSFCSSTPCSSLLFLLPHSLSSLVHSWLSFPSVCWMSFTPRFPLDCSSRDFPSFSMSFTLLVRRIQVHYREIYIKNVLHTQYLKKKYSPSQHFYHILLSQISLQLIQSLEHHVKSKEKFQKLSTMY